MDSKLEAEFQEAVAKGHVARLAALLHTHPELAGWASPADGATALHTAAFHGRDDSLQALLAAAPDLMAATARGRTALHVATSRGHAKCAALLLEAAGGSAGELLRATDADKGWSAAHMAALCGKDEMLGVLIAAGADLEQRDASSFTPLLLAAARGHIPCLRLLLAGGAQPDAADASGKTALCNAAEAGRVDMLRALLDAGAGLGATGPEGRTALHAAAAAGQEAAVHALLAAGADVDAKDARDRTPLHLAASMGYLPCVEALLAEGADVHAVDLRGGWTALHMAADRGHRRVVRALLSAGAPPDTPTGLGRDDAALISGAVRLPPGGPAGGQTALMKAAAKGHLACVRALLEGGAVLEAQAVRGWTAAHFAAHLGQAEALAALLQAGADKEARSHGARRPLMLAAGGGHETCVRLLLERGASVDARDHCRQTALHFAAQQSQEACLQALLAAGAATDSVDSKRRTPLLCVAEAGSEGCLSALLAAGADPTAADKDGLTAMHRAAQASRLLMLQHLARAGAPLSCTTSGGATPRELAEQAGNSAAASLLLELEQAASRSGGSDSFASAGADDPLLLWISHQLSTRLSLTTGVEALGSREMRWDQLHIQGCIGEGSFAKVYSALHHHTQVAVKVLLRREGPSSMAQALSLADPSLADLRQEALLMAELHHPHIVHLLGVCVYPAAIITEYCARGSLLDVLKACGSQPRRPAPADLGPPPEPGTGRRQGSAAPAHSAAAHPAPGPQVLQPAGRLGVAHQGLRLQPVQGPAGGRLRLALHRLPAAQPALAGELAGRAWPTAALTNPSWPKLPAHQAPEVLGGQVASRASDAYSFGVVMWELLSLRVPWASITAAQQWQLPLEVMAGKRPEVPAREDVPGDDTPAFSGLDSYIDLMQRCWAQEPAERPTFDQIVLELRGILQKHTAAHQPSKAQPAEPSSAQPSSTPGTPPALPPAPATAADSAQDAASQEH